jgi:hypothetical protein
MGAVDIGVVPIEFDDRRALGKDDVIQVQAVIRFSPADLPCTIPDFAPVPTQNLDQIPRSNCASGMPRACESSFIFRKHGSFRPFSNSLK